MSEPIQRLRTGAQSEQTSAAKSAQQIRAAEFATPEEAIRADAHQTVVPPAVRERIVQSAAAEPRLDRRPWWKRFLGGED